MNHVSAIVPAHNEAPRIANVLCVLKTVPCIREIIVVDDGSHDGTGHIAEGCGVRVVRNLARQGKGQALEKGVQKSSGEVLFFCDADVRGLTSAIVEEIINPVLCGNVEMSIGARASKIRNFGFGLTYSPLLDGQRALRRELWERIPMFQKKGYRAEVTLNHSARSVVHRIYPIYQTTKEEKLGPIHGRYARGVMYSDIILAHLLSCLQAKR